MAAVVRLTINIAGLDAGWEGPPFSGMHLGTYLHFSFKAKYRQKYLTFISTSLLDILEVWECLCSLFIMLVLEVGKLPFLLLPSQKHQI